MSNDSVRSYLSRQGSKGAQARLEKMTKEEREAHIRKMNEARLAKRSHSDTFENDLHNKHKTNNCGYKKG